MQAVEIEVLRKPALLDGLSGWRARVPWLGMVFTGLVLRLLVSAFLYTDQMDPKRDHWVFAYENGRVARSIATGEGFSNPLFEKTGPTALIPPVFPYILAGVFKVFGVYTVKSALAILSINSLFSALTAIPIFLIALRIFGERAARWSGWGWAFFPYGIYFTADWVWGTYLATLLLAFAFLLALELEYTGRPLKWLGFGALCGVATLTEPAVLSVLPFLGAWICYRRYLARARWGRVATLTAVSFLTVISPWCVRNYEVFHRMVPFRTGFGLELYVGNNGYSDYWVNRSLYPAHNDAELSEFDRVGEIAYMHHKLQQGTAYISAHKTFFAWMSFRRAVYLWTGFWSLSRGYLHQEPLDPANMVVCTALTVLALLGLRRAFRNGLAEAVPFVLVLILYPLVYCFTHPEVYYRRPIDPMFVLLACYFLSSRTLKLGRTKLKERVESKELETVYS